MIDYSSSASSIPFEFGLLAVLPVLLLVIVQVMFALGVYQAAGDLEREGRGTEIVSPVWWALGTLVTGFVGLGMFWALHYAPVFSRAHRPLTFEERRDLLRNRYREGGRSGKGDEGA